MSRGTWFRDSSFRLRASGFGFRVSGFGFRVSGFGFRVPGLGSRVLGFGFWVLGFGFRVSGFGFRISGFGFRVSGFGFRVLGFGFRVSGFGFRVLVRIAGDEGIFGLVVSEFLSLCTLEPPLFPTILPIIGAVTDPIPGYSRNPCAVRCAVSTKTTFPEIRSLHCTCGLISQTALTTWFQRVNSSTTSSTYC